MQRFTQITISSPSILDYPATTRILENLKKLNLLPENFESPLIVDSDQVSKKLSLQAQDAAAPNNHPVILGKRILHLTTQPGTFIKQCPGTNNMLCCHYHIVNMVSNCPFDCTYCYLQTYLNQPMTTFFVNEDDIFNQVRALCARPPVQELRVGTGELSDSLALDPITGFSSRLAVVMSEFQNVRLELKTKSKNVEQLLEIPAGKRSHVVISWSMNPAIIVNEQEHGTARFHERLLAARFAVDSGFSVGFHFDPMIYIDHWQKHYEQAIDELLATIPADKIKWISIGGLRYLPQLKNMALKRRPESKIFDDDAVTGADGKVRYLRSQRTLMFSHLNSYIKTLAPSVYTYLCMESVPVWENALGRLPDRQF